MAIRYTYTYRTYDGVPAATSASRAFSSGLTPLGMMILPASAFLGYVLNGFIDNVLASVICILLLDVTGIILYLRSYDPKIIRAMINSLDYSNTQKRY